jgi:hypothetical protein
MNYVELRAAIQEYSENFEASFVDNVDLFIQLAESRVLLRVRLPNFRKEATGSLPLGTDQLAMPGDFLSPDSMRVTDLVTLERELLLPKDPEFIRECYPLSELGMPRFYAMINESAMLFGPVPENDCTLDMAYYFQPPSIIVTGVSWMGDHFAHALVTGALVEACTYMKTEDNLYQRYNSAFEKDLAMDQQYAKGRAKKDTYTEPDIRVKV